MVSADHPIASCPSEKLFSALLLAALLLEGGILILLPVTSVPVAKETKTMRIKPPRQNLWVEIGALSSPNGMIVLSINDQPGGTQCLLKQYSISWKTTRGSSSARSASEKGGLRSLPSWWTSSPGREAAPNVRCADGRDRSTIPAERPGRSITFLCGATGWSSASSLAGSDVPGMEFRENGFPGWTGKSK